MAVCRQSTCSCHLIGAQCEAKEEESSNVVASDSCDVSRLGASLEPASYARAQLLVGKVNACEGDLMLPPIVVATGAVPNKDATRVIFSETSEAHGLGKAPQQKCVAWRSGL